MSVFRKRRHSKVHIVSMLKVYISMKKRYYSFIKSNTTNNTQKISSVIKRRNNEDIYLKSVYLKKKSKS